MKGDRIVKRAPCTRRAEDRSRGFEPCAARKKSARRKKFFMPRGDWKSRDEMSKIMIDHR
jgi:hypothetical protein